MKTSIKNSQITAHFNTKGAELCSFQKNDTQREYIWNGDATYWNKHSPILFPIVGTLKNNSYTFKNKTYNLPRHGFARDCHFTIIHHSEDEIVFSLNYDNLSLKMYPFLYELQIKYSLVDAKLIIQYSVINKDVKPIPFSIGAHPAFALPQAFENYSLEFEKQEVLHCFLLENDLLSKNNYEIKLLNKKLPLTYSLFENDALIFKSFLSKEITLIEKETKLLKVTFPNFKNLGLWTKNGASFICIEPWLGYSDDKEFIGELHEKDGIQIVKENLIFQCEFAIEIL